MGVRILCDPTSDLACLYCSTSDWAFGPVFYGQTSESAEEQAQQFLQWLDSYEPPSDHFNSPWRHRQWRHDPRQLTDRGLEVAYSQWTSAREDAKIEGGRLEEMRRILEDCASRTPSA